MNGVPGFVISWRSKWEHPIFRRKQEAAVWAWMCDTAQWQDYRMPTKFGPIDLKRGELIISEREVAEDFGLHRNTLRKLIQRMVDDGMITLIRDRTPHRSGTIVGIVKYEQYQQFGQSSEEGQDRKPTEARTEEGPKEDRSGTKNKQDNTYNEDNEESPLSPPKGEVSEPGLFGDLAPAPVPTKTGKPKKPRRGKAETPPVPEEIFQAFWSINPPPDEPNKHRHNEKATRHNMAKTIESGVDPQELINAWSNYRDKMKFGGKFHTEFIKAAQNFVSLTGREWEKHLEPFVPPKTNVTPFRPGYGNNRNGYSDQPVVVNKNVLTY
jgi:hypothetical protein